MAGTVYTERLGALTDAQFQAALDHFDLGRLVRAEPIPFGLFGQNVFVTSTTGDYVLRGTPHFWWQFPTEQFYARQLYERTSVPVPWPYLIDDNTDVFGWSYAIMPRMPGLQLADPQVRNHLERAVIKGIAQALGHNLARMQELMCSVAGRYSAATNAVEVFDLATELAWPFAVSDDLRLVVLPPSRITFSERVKALIRHNLARAQASQPAATTPGDLAWVEEVIAEAGDALNDSFEPCFVMEDYKEGNLVVTKGAAGWYVSGVFDLMGGYFGDGEADLSRQAAVYLDEDPDLARAFVQAYLQVRPSRPGFDKRFPVYMLLDRAILWEFFQRNRIRGWPETWTFRDWASQYTSVDLFR